MPVAPSLGWTLLSREAIKRAESQLLAETEGVRDEIGFLAIHQAYSDRLFPGTSVLHTRLRYVLFVPWIFQRLAAQGSRETAARRLQEEERRLAGRLKGQDGVIGGRIYPSHSAQPPSMVYWSAMARWGLLNPRPDGSLPARSDALRALGASRRASSRVADDDRQALESMAHAFVDVPNPPLEWDEPAASLDFRLHRPESSFLRTRMSAVERPDGGGAQALIAVLAERGVDLETVESPWNSQVLAVADRDDRLVLKHARQAASLAAVGRAVYAALVEEWREDVDHQPTGRLHRDDLQETIRRHRMDALGLEIASLPQDDLALANDPILSVLAATQEWLRKPAPIAALRDVYEDAERRRKGLRRARLGSHLFNRERRREWQPDQHALAQPLHYRWSQVKRLLKDLKAAR